MIQVKDIKNLSDFQRLKKGDIVACEFRRDNYIGNKRTRFAVYTIVENKERTTEIILQTKNNVYFNYSMFLKPKEHGVSNLRSIVLLKSIVLEEN